LFGTGGAINSPAVRAAILANGNTLDPTVTQTGIRIFSNGLDTRTRGVDLLASYSTDLGELGGIDWSLAANYSDTKVTRIAPPPSQLAAGVALFDKAAISDLETTAPEFRVVASALWTFGDLSVNLKEAYYGESSNFQTRTGAIYYENIVSPTFITDLDIAYKVLEGVTVSVGANNLFNEYPDGVNAAAKQDYLAVNSQSYTGKYPAFSPFGINGGYCYGKLTFGF
jgi:iron complex outermembrane receptor protein